MGVAMYICAHTLYHSKRSLLVVISVVVTDILKTGTCSCHSNRYYAHSRSQPDMTSYIQSITSIPGDAGVVDLRGDTKLHQVCSCLPKPVVDVLSEMLDISLLTNTGFMLICLGNILAMIGFYVPYVYLVDRAVLAGIDKTQASFLLSVIGKLSAKLAVNECKLTRWETVVLRRG